ncbi:MAG TPA: DinB family protein [Terriglobales bacterium]
MSEAVTSPRNTMIGRPQAGDYAPHYEKYIAKLEDDDVLAILDQQRRQMLLLLSSRSEADGDFRYAPGKWSVREVVGHICDVERVFAYRALTISRGDQTALPGFDENAWAENAPWGHRRMEDLIEEYIAVRRATISLFRNLDEAAWNRRGDANGHVVTVRALAYIIAGHELHHRHLLEERYFAAAA